MGADVIFPGEWRLVIVFERNSPQSSWVAGFVGITLRGGVAREEWVGQLKDRATGIWALGPSFYSSSRDRAKARLSPVELRSSSGTRPDPSGLGRASAN